MTYATLEQVKEALKEYVDDPKYIFGECRIYEKIFNRKDYIIVLHKYDDEYDDLFCDKIINLKTLERVKSITKKLASGGIEIDAIHFVENEPLYDNSKDTDEPIFFHDSIDIAYYRSICYDLKHIMYTGKFIEYCYHDGNIIEEVAYYKDGVRHGSCEKYYYDSLQLEFKCDYENGSRVGEVNFIMKMACYYVNIMPKIKS